MPAPDLHHKLVARLRASSKYQGLCDEMLHWAVAEALTRTRTSKDALKLAKRRLHQAYGAFVDAARRKSVLKTLDVASEVSERERLEALRRAAALHQSTAERMNHHRAMWDYLRSEHPPPNAVADLGCGLNPALLPWTGLSRDVGYHGVDLDVSLCDALQRALVPLFPNVRVTARDLQSVSVPPADLTLCWKLFPTLERQRAGAARSLLARVGPTVIVATFPTRTLTGRETGMEQTYRTLADRLFGPGEARVIGDELVRVVSWPGGSDAD